MNKQELEGVLELHHKWLIGEGGECANLTNANLRYANLTNADLRYADLRYADLRDVNLTNADLRDVNLTNADLTNADLTNANLRYANLTNADLTNADLRYADLRGVNLTSADLRDVNLDFSVMPLWCGDLKAHYDEKQIIQQLYHVLSHVKHSKNSTDRLKKHLLTDELRDLTNEFHRIDEVEKI